MRHSLIVVGLVAVTLCMGFDCRKGDRLGAADVDGGQTEGDLPFADEIGGCHADVYDTAVPEGGCGWIRGTDTDGRSGEYFVRCVGGTFDPNENMQVDESENCTFAGPTTGAGGSLTRQQQQQLDTQQFMQLAPLSPMTPPATWAPMPMLVSNNPETVTSTGVLLAAGAPPPSGRSMVGNTSACLRDFGVFLAHYNRVSGTPRTMTFHLVVSSRSPIQVDSEGRVEVGPVTQSDIGNSPATRVVDAWLSRPSGSNTADGSVNAGTYFSVFSRDVPYQQIIEGRLRVRVTSSDPSACAIARLVVTERGAAAAGAVGRHASGNISRRVSGSSYGRPSGLYEADVFYARREVTLRATSGARGLTGVQISRADLVPGPSDQSFPAIAHYEDSDPRSTGNFGVDYVIDQTITNDSGECRQLAAVFRSYQLIGTTLTPSRLWDGTAVVTNVDNGQVTRQDIQTSPAWNDREQRLASATLAAGARVNWRFHLPVPGLTSIPAGLLFRWTPCP